MTSTSAHLTLRLDLSDKERIDRAAVLRGMTVSSFVRDAALREAERVMAAEQTITLLGAESAHFLKALDTPFQPNIKLKKAMAAAARGAKP